MIIMDHAIRGFQLIEYFSSQFLYIPKASLLGEEPQEVESFELQKRPKVDKMDRQSVDCLGRAFIRAGLVDLLWEITQSFDGRLAFCSTVAASATGASTWKPVYCPFADSSNYGRVIGVSAQEVSKVRRVSYSKCAELYYYFLDELRLTL